jgi:High potential iron-sulfur protein
MRHDPSNQSRRVLLARSAKMVGVVALATVFGRSTPAIAKAAKSEFMYQDHPHDSKSCSQCRFYVPTGPNSDAGSCSIVDGPISQSGWCNAFTPKIVT